ncbi:hypothetical protein HMPREF9602_02058 [Cutibacterium acnes HL030PA2]|nr:hypothetical protein HMPREF9602_02058 [Cutibacterium acnes HL030PA2]
MAPERSSSGTTNMTGGASDRPTITTPKDLATKLRLQRILPNGCRSHRTDKQVNFANSYGTHILSQPDLADTYSQSMRAWQGHR